MGRGGCRARTGVLDSAAGRGVAQLGSALAWGARGRWFKSSRPDHVIPETSPARGELEEGSPLGLPCAPGGDAG
jgi:hypothetical protein